MPCSQSRQYLGLRFIAPRNNPMSVHIANSHIEDGDGFSLQRNREVCGGKIQMFTPRNLIVFEWALRITRVQYWERLTIAK